MFSLSFYLCLSPIIYVRSKSICPRQRHSEHHIAISDGLPRLAILFTIAASWLSLGSHFGGERGRYRERDLKNLVGRVANLSGMFITLVPYTIYIIIYLQQTSTYGVYGKIQSSYLCTLMFV